MTEVKTESSDVVEIISKAKMLAEQVRSAKDDASKRRAAVSFMAITDTALRSHNRTGALLINLTKELRSHGIGHKDLINLVSGANCSPAQKHYVKTMAIVMNSSSTPAGREQIRKNGINYQELEQAIGSERFGALKSFLSGE